MTTKILERGMWGVGGVTGVMLAAALGACGSVSDKPADAGVDGAPAAMPGDYRWVRSMSSATPVGIGDGAGGLVVTAYFNAPADVGGGTLTPAGMTDALIAGYMSDGTHVFSVRHGGDGSEFPFLDTVTSVGAPIVFGVSYGATVDLGQGPVSGGGGADADGFIGLYGPGQPSWVQRSVGSGEDKIVSTAPGPASTVYGAGWFEGTTSFNGGALTSTAGATSSSRGSTRPPARWT